MKADDLELDELLAFDSKGGVVHFAGQRALILDATAHGLLRKELIQTFGADAARGILTRFGYVHGRSMAEAMRAQFPWDNEDEWQRAGARIHTLQGLVLPARNSPSLHLGEPATWRVSYEAEQHLLHLGRAEQPVCWTLCGLASGYLSTSMGEEIYVVEDRCMARGDAVCRVTARTRKDWGEEIGPHLSYFENAGLDAAMQRVADSLKRTEQKLRSRARKLASLARLEGEDLGGIVARSESMRRVVQDAKRVAAVDSTVMISGESGTGKERIARLVHEQSACMGGPFIAVNCGSVAEGLLESELFGHARGAFTGATLDRPGLFEAASGGTLFLDEVADIPPAMQVKLLRAIQEREIRRVGENRSRPIDVRILTATNQDLLLLVDARRFRKDLFYRLNVVELRVPPLRERRNDLLPLARIFLAEAALHMRRDVEGLSPAAADRLLRYDWPGNVRELENAMERAVALSAGRRIEWTDLPPALREPLPNLAAHGELRTLREVEDEYILAALERHGGSRARTAEVLGIGIATLHRRLRGLRRGSPSGRNGGAPARPERSFTTPPHPPELGRRGP